MEDVSCYKYITNGNLTVTGSSDRELYIQLIEALHIMGINQQDIHSKQHIINIHVCEILIYVHFSDIVA